MGICRWTPGNCVGAVLCECGGDHFPRIFRCLSGDPARFGLGRLSELPEPAQGGHVQLFQRNADGQHIDLDPCGEVRNHSGLQRPFLRLDRPPSRSLFPAAAGGRRKEPAKRFWLIACLVLALSFAGFAGCGGGGSSTGGGSQSKQVTSSGVVSGFVGNREQGIGRLATSQ